MSMRYATVSMRYMCYAMVSMPTDLCCTSNCRGTCTKSWSDGRMVEQIAKVLEELAEQGKLEETVAVLEKSKRTSTRKDDSQPRMYTTVYSLFKVSLPLCSPTSLLQCSSALLPSA